MSWWFLLFLLPSIHATCPPSYSQGDRCSVTIRTGQLRNAGTDANVRIVFHGRVSSAPFYPNSPRNDFENGNTDVFYVSLPDLFPLTTIDIGHDNSGRRPGWYLESVDVYCPNAEIDMHFPAQRWLATDENDGRLDVTLEGNSNKRCPIRQPIRNGSMTCTFGRSWGSRCSVTCARGTTLRGPSCLHCLGSQQWDYPEGSTTCE